MEATRRQRWRDVACLAAIALLFLIVNRTAYRGFFSDDDLDNLLHSRFAPLGEFISGFFSPRLSPINYRPVGALWYRLLDHPFQLWFPPYVAALHFLHLANVTMLFGWLRRLGLTWWSAAAGCLFFAFHLAAFAAYWKPMYVYDVLAAFFCLLTLLLYQADAWVPPLFSFWLAYKSKEFAVMLPVVLIGCEYLFQQRRWRRLIPFVLLSLSFGLQAIWGNRVNDTDYALRLTPQSFLTCIRFYAAQVGGFPGAGLIFVVLAALLRSRRALLGLLLFGALLLPMLLLPGRLNAVYLYAPLAGLALIFADAVARWPSLALAALLIWVPWNYQHFRHFRAATLEADRESQRYVEAVETLYRARAQNWQAAVFDGTPASLQRWGIDAIFRYLAGAPNMPVYSIEQPESSAALSHPDTALLTWRRAQQQAIPELSAAPSYITMGSDAAGRYLGPGWYAMEAQYRWSAPRAEVRLRQTSTHLTVDLGAVEDAIKAGGPVTVQVLLDVKVLGTETLSQAGRRKLEFTTPPVQPGLRRVELRVTPPYRPSNGDPRTLGVPVFGFGFPMK